jgi:iron complex transport system substrate-binding protein
LGLPEKAAAVRSGFNRDLEAALALTAVVESKPKGLFILSGGGRPTLVAGGNTDIALLIEMAGGQNMTADITDFKPMSQEKMLEAAPDFILINKEGSELQGDIPAAMTAPGVQLTPAAIHNHVITLPSGYLAGLGLTTPKAIEALARQIHPELSDDS